MKYRIEVFFTSEADYLLVAGLGGIKERFGGLWPGFCREIAAR